MDVSLCPMPYVILPDGSIQTDSPNEAIRLSQMIRAVPARAVAPAPVMTLVQREMTIAGSPLISDSDRFVSKLKPNQKKVLETLQKRQRIGIDDMRAALGLETNMAVGGVTSSIAKIAVRESFDLPSLMLTIKEGAKRNVFYISGPKLKEVIFK